MFIKQSIVETSHVRKSKLGIEHTYTRKKTLVHFRCDNCSKEFYRERGSMDPKRLSNNYFHVCDYCNSKKFAQRKGVERKKVWNLSASSNLGIGKL
jgi:DNA-directed RNA polymerase subunit RPC12/RpoP